MNDELDAFRNDHTDLEWLSAVICADEHRELIELEDPDRVAIRVEDLLIGDAVLAGATITGSTTSRYLDAVIGAAEAVPAISAVDSAVVDSAVSDAALRKCSVRYSDACRGMPVTSASVVGAFNDAINDRDLKALTARWAWGTMRLVAGGTLWGRARHGGGIRKTN